MTVPGPSAAGGPGTTRCACGAHELGTLGRRLVVGTDEQAVDHRLEQHLHIGSRGTYCSDGYGRRIPDVPRPSQPVDKPVDDHPAAPAGNRCVTPERVHVYVTSDACPVPRQRWQRLDVAIRVTTRQQSDPPGHKHCFDRLDRALIAHASRLGLDLIGDTMFSLEEIPAWPEELILHANRWACPRFPSSACDCYYCRHPAVVPPGIPDE